MSTAAAVSGPEEAASLGYTVSVKLAKPYFSGWQQVPARSPRGYWANSELDNWTGGVMLQMGSLSDFQQNPLIGWASAGWKRPGVWALAGDLFVLQANTGQVIAEGYGGQTRPRVFLSLHPQGGAAPIEERADIGTNGHYQVIARAPRNGYYTVHAEFNIRSVRQGYAYPYCKINGTLDYVYHIQRRFGPGVAFAAAEELPEGVDRTYRPPAQEFADEELAEQLASLEKAPGIEIPDGPEAFATAEIT